MSEFSVVEINSIRGMEVTADGQYLLIRSDGSTAAIHQSIFKDLLVALPNAIEHSERLAQNTAGLGFALHCQGWEIGRIDGTPNLVIRFVLSGNAALSFSLPCYQVPDMLTALSGAAGVTTTPPDSELTLQ